MPLPIKRITDTKAKILGLSFDLETGQVKIFQIKLVMDETMIKSEEEMAKEMREELEGEKLEEQRTAEGEIRKVRFNPEKHIMIDEAKKIDKKMKPGDEMQF